MTKDLKDKTTVAQPVPEQPQGGTQPGIQIVSQYIRDLSFENPNAPESLVSGWPAPETNVQIFLGQKTIKENVYECMTHFRIEAKKKDDSRSCFLIDIHYGALTVLHNIPAEHHQAMMMVEVPKLLFPFVREVVANLTASGGYPPLYLSPVSFEGIYMQEMKRLQAEQGKAKAAS